MKAILSELPTWLVDVLLVSCDSLYKRRGNPVGTKANCSKSIPCEKKVLRVTQAASIHSRTAELWCCRSRVENSRIKTQPKHCSVDFWFLLDDGANESTKSVRPRGEHGLAKISYTQSDAWQSDLHHSRNEVGRISVGQTASGPNVVILCSIMPTTRVHDSVRVLYVCIGSVWFCSE